MASIIPGYEYDIFISYRQKDNNNGILTVVVPDEMKMRIVMYHADAKLNEDVA